ncbi:opaque-specific ABC transporter CDR3 [Scheffersomyces xylosifermentans]|uniref:opaque-specific ABC transporter CDR3 n=1 Tax=Scheffersomyces xylosifermentans TaxID=1304137 RepID=UPI00315C7024
MRIVHPSEREWFSQHYRGFSLQAEEQVHNLARNWTHGAARDFDKESAIANDSESFETLASGVGAGVYQGHIPRQSPFFDSSDPSLDPDSPLFSSRRWIQNMRRLMDSDEDYYKPSSLGFAYKNLRVYGDLAETDYQTTLSNAIPKWTGQFIRYLRKDNSNMHFDILKPMEGLIRPGEVTVVLGRPGAGCSTFLKTVSCHTYGFNVDKDSVLSYDGLTPEEIKNNLRGEVVYCAETETHFPHLTVRKTLDFTSMMKTPKNRLQGITREKYARHMSDVVMATYGLSHTKNTKVGNDFIRGVSGGERKRVSIAEIALIRAPLQCWDNSTRGLDAATALEFISSLKTSATIMNETPMIAIYQCSQDAYDMFDKVILLYEGYQIYFGSSKTAKKYFLKMGFDCAFRQTTADFLTSLTNPAERIVRPGFEGRVPNTPQEFYDYWLRSPERARLVQEIDEYVAYHANKQTHRLLDSHRAKQANFTNKRSPYTVSYAMQVRYIIKRNWERMRGDPSFTIFTFMGNTGMGLILASVFVNMKETTSTLYYRTAIMFFAVLFNAYASILEIFSLYEARPVVEKHKNYALYRPSADALANIITELPVKIVTCISFNTVVYFMVNFRRTASHYFFYLLVSFTITLSMSHIFRAIGASTKSLAQAMTPASILLLGLTTFTGFAIPTPYMPAWCRWMNYIDPLAYAFDALISNEFHDRNFKCSRFIPSGPGYPTEGDSITCAVLGSTAGSPVVNGDEYIKLAFNYFWKNRWRNWGILFAFSVFFLIIYIIIVENSKAAVQKGEVLVFQRKSLDRYQRKQKRRDAETGNLEKLRHSDHGEYINRSRDSDELIGNKLLETADTFHWRQLSYSVRVPSEGEKQLLKNIDGWVKPGEVTALMGASGAGKTTLLNALSDRLTTGVITSGTRMVNGGPLDSSFQRSIGYVQQSDLHLQTSTVREALRFSAYLRQPRSVSKAEKNEYVENIIQLLEMEKYANAVVGVEGEGLNVEQRKRLTIGVELVAKPKLLLFLDEPTSGLDSETAWSICKLIRKLADHGQAILCTIHQPSAILLQEFDRLLLLQAGGETVYFGELGRNCSMLINYFEKYGAPKCPRTANPAEWMLNVIGAAPGSRANQDYFQVWLKSSEYRDVQRELNYFESELSRRPTIEDPESKRSFAASIWTQYIYVCKRVFEQYWRTPSYIYSKLLMAILSSAYNGFTFYKSDNSIQGMQNQMLSVFLIFIILSTLIQQYLPLFVSQRDLYEARERPSKTFSWVAFITAQITVELPFQIIAGTLSFFCWYYPIGMYENAVPTDAVVQRGALMWLSITLLFIYSSTLGQLCISFNEITDNAANMVSLFVTMSMTFCGVLATPAVMPRFWIFMYRCNPFTYMVSVILSVGLAKAEVKCSDQEYFKFSTLNSTQTCGEYMQVFKFYVGGYLRDETATQCEFCPIDNTNMYLDSIGASYKNIGRDLGIFIAFIAVNVVGTIFLYWLARVPKGNRQKRYPSILENIVRFLSIFNMK